MAEVTMEPRRPIRCAVYTRKSTDEGLDQAFNSLDAQREACEAYIVSQALEGWTRHPERYDDGGFSGGTMDRPALGRLLADVAAGAIDVIVIYKIDRLTRSLADFARIVEVIERSGASFVSITQQFNTTTSMGRLTLNVLLSFAQFEREVGAERVRDKIAASKKKGMWMGGVCPLGYDVKDRSLVVNHAEAATVRLIFQLYLELGSVPSLEIDLDHRGIRSKQRHRRSGCLTGGGRLTRGALYQILKNVLYIGRVSHRGNSYEGQQQAIVDTDIFARAQAMLEANRVRRGVEANARGRALLAGLVWDHYGRRLSPTHSLKGSRRYNYYASRISAPADGNHSIVRVPAGDLELIIVERLCAFLTDRSAIYRLLEPASLNATKLGEVFASAEAMALRLGGEEREQGSAASQLLEKVVAREESVELTIKVGAFVGDHIDPKACLAATHVIEAPGRCYRRAKEVRMTIPGQYDGQASRRDIGLIKLVVRAFEARQTFERSNGKSLKELAAERGSNIDYFTVLIKLGYLAPDIVDAILEGAQPPELTRQRLARVRALPFDWETQRTLLGFRTRRDPQPSAPSALC
jgi:site-specific DNA recombinase